jgi:GTP cyclohydrolase II
MSTEQAAQLPTEIVSRDWIHLDRALFEFRRGRPVILYRGQLGLVALPAELVNEASLQWLRSFDREPRLALTRERAQVYQLPLTDELAAIVYRLETLSSAEILALADPLLKKRLPHHQVSLDRTIDQALAQAAITLAKMAELLPAAVLARLPGADALGLAQIEELVALPAQQIHALQSSSAARLERIVDARVPLVDAPDTHIIAFRPRWGGAHHLAIVVGELDVSQPVLIRLHSECFTGDLLGSLRCDCGDQLRGAIQELRAAGSGVLLYLAQEGRGIGLINKLRAYTLQDSGLDTVDANLHLGYGADERIYTPAAEILAELNIHRVRLMTNNPDKLAALEAAGVHVVERVPHIFSSNEHNWLYLQTKATRSGHLF